MTAADAPIVRAGFRALSPESLRLRFFSPVPRLTGSILQDLTAVDPEQRIVLLAFHTATGALAGGVRAVRWRDDPARADVAVTVGESWRGRGLGTALLQLLGKETAAKGIQFLGGHVLVDNRPARAMIRRAGGSTSFEEPGVLRFEVPLAARVPALQAS